MSRRDVANETGLSHSTVSKAVGDLVELGFLIEEPARTIGLGRPVVPLRWDDSRWVLIGVKIVDEDQRPGRLVGVVTSLGGTVLTEPIPRDLTANERTDGTELARAFAALVGELQHSLGTEQRVLGVGVELGGHIDHGRVVLSVNLGWDNAVGGFDLRSEFSDATGYQVVVQNDANALAIYENLYKMIETPSFLVAVVLHDGVGGALVIDGKLRRGAEGSAGELGHLKIDTSTEARKCRCDKLGHVEAYATPRAIMASYPLARNWAEAVSSASSDSTGRQAFRTAGRALGLGIANVATMNNPDRIVIYLPPELVDAVGGTAGAEYRSVLEETLYEEAFSTSRDTPVEYRRMSQSDADRLGACAAAVTVLQDFVDSLEQPERITDAG